MKQFFFITILIWSLSSYSQSGFQFPEGVDKIEIPFQSVYNLIIIPTVINGVDMKMILDTGASKSIIFNFSNLDSLIVEKGKLLKVSGYGESDLYKAYYTGNNRINVNGYENSNGYLFVAAEKEINLKPILGLSVNGLLGASFFQNDLVELNYVKKKVVVYRSDSKKAAIIRRKSSIPLTLNNGKPYIEIEVGNNNTDMTMTSLMDTGNGDALWLLNTDKNFKRPTSGFQDQIGVGLNGYLNGIRSKTDYLILADYKLNKVTTSIPDSLGLKNDFNSNPKEGFGSIGGEVLSRFKIFLDYKNNKVFFVKNKNFASGFFYNMAGINVVQGADELFVVREQYNYKNTQIGYREGSDRNLVSTTQKYSFKKIPRLIINYVRPNSPGDKAGLMEGDEIIKFNNKSKRNLSTAEIIARLHQKPYSEIKITFKRKELEKKVKIQLIPVVE